MNKTEKEKDEMRAQCLDFITLLNRASNDPILNWATIFVDCRLYFARRWCDGLIFSTLHGANFFDNIISCLDGKKWEPDNKGEYEQNFRELIKRYKK